MVEEKIQHDGQRVDNHPQDITPPPLQPRVLVKRPRDRRPKHGERHRRRQHEGIHRAPEGIRHQLAQDDVKGELPRGRDAVNGIRRDQRVDAPCRGADDGAHQPEHRGRDEEPPPAEDVGQTAHEREADCEAGGPGDGDPDEVWGGADGLVDEGEGVGGEDPA